MKALKGKKWLCGVGALIACSMLTGCHMSHEWQEATCTEPRTCSVCGETEGEALGHTWIEATCSEPRHCSVCGETEGEALEHTLTEADYQQPATCEVCGKTVGEPLQAEFEKYELVSAALDKEYPYVIPCFNDPAYYTTGKVVFSDYETFSSSDTCEALEGYEWKAVTVTFTFDDENAQQYGARSTFFTVDYYHGGDPEEKVNYNGVDYTECITNITEVKNEWNGNVLTKQFLVQVRVPEGYDGVAIATLNGEQEELDALLSLLAEPSEYNISNAAENIPVYFRFN